MQVWNCLDSIIIPMTWARYLRSLFYSRMTQLEYQCPKHFVRILLPQPGTAICLGREMLRMRNQNEQTALSKGEDNLFLSHNWLKNDGYPNQYIIHFPVCLSPTYSPKKTTYIESSFLYKASWPLFILFLVDFVVVAVFVLGQGLSM